MHWPGPMVLEFSSCLVVSAPPVGHFSSGSSHPLFFYCKMSLQYHLVASFNVQCVWHHNPATGFQPPSAIVVSAEPFSHGTGTLRCLGNGETQMMSHIVKSCLLTKLYCGLSRLHCGWRRCFVADQLWFMSRIILHSFQSHFEDLHNFQFYIVVGLICRLPYCGLLHLIETSSSCPQLQWRPTADENRHFA